MSARDSGCVGVLFALSPAIALAPHTHTLPCHSLDVSEEQGNMRISRLMMAVDVLGDLDLVRSAQRAWV